MQFVGQFVGLAGMSECSSVVTVGVLVQPQQVGGFSGERDVNKNGEV